MKKSIAGAAGCMAAALALSTYSGLPAPVFQAQFINQSMLTAQAAGSEAAAPAEVGSVNLTQIAYDILSEHSNRAAGNPSTFAASYRTLIDVDENGTVDTDDASTVLSWFATIAASGESPSAAARFFERFGELRSSGTLSKTTTTAGSVTGTTTTSTGTGTSSETTTETTTEEATTETTTEETTTEETTTEETTTEETTTEETTTEETTTEETTTTVETTLPDLQTGAVYTDWSDFIHPEDDETGTSVSAHPLTGAWAKKDIYEGIDVSMYQLNVDYNAVKAAGKDFVIVRAGYGRYASQKDSYFDQNMRNAKAADMAVGVYWYSYAMTPEDARMEAAACAEVIAGYQLELPVFYDFEDPTQMYLSMADASAIVEAFCDEMAARGYYVSIYSYANFLQNRISDELLQKYDIWAAHYGVSAPSYTRSEYGIWQYSGSGTVSGISTLVDLDYCYRCYPIYIEQHHLNGY